MDLSQTSWSRTIRGLMLPLPVILESQDDMSVVDGATIEPRIRINRPDDENTRCRVSSVRGQPKDFSQLTQPPTHFQRPTSSHFCKDAPSLSRVGYEHVARGQPVLDFGFALMCAVIGIAHLAKGSAGKDPVERIMGSIAFAGHAQPSHRGGQLPIRIRSSYAHRPARCRSWTRKTP